MTKVTYHPKPVIPKLTTDQARYPEVKRDRYKQDKKNADFPTGRLLLVNEQGKT
ncbi:MAG: hypothetical protein IJW58_00470 [Clostridia bacterium]|nr:hypothetical protein [Clostridia bacterium]